MIEAVNRIYGYAWDGKHIVVFGLGSCDYVKVRKVFERKGLTSYTCGIGVDAPDVEKPKKQGIVQIRAKYDLFNDGRMCKAAITNIVFFNYVRLEQNQSIVPFIFCMEKDGVDDSLSLETITDKLPLKHKIVTASEIRRAYKHCTDPGLSDKIKLVAQMTFRFVRVVESLDPGQDPYELIEIPAPWADPSFQLRFAVRIAGRQSLGVSNWRGQLNELVEEYDRTKEY